MRRGARPVRTVRGGASHTCVLLKGGSVRCWGSAIPSGYGNLEVISDDEIPASVGTVDIGALTTQLSAGGSHTCGLLQNDLNRCWGYGSGGRLGYGNQDDTGGYGNVENIGDDEIPASAGDVPYR